MPAQVKPGAGGTAALRAAESSLACTDDCMRTVVHLQLGEDARHIVAYGVLAEHEAACDVPIAVALSDQLEDLALALGKFRELGRGEGPPGGREVLHDTRGDGRPEYGPALADPA